MVIKYFIASDDDITVTINAIRNNSIIVLETQCVTDPHISIIAKTIDKTKQIIVRSFETGVINVGNSIV